MTFEEAFAKFIVAYEAERHLQERFKYESGLDATEGIYLSRLRDLASEALYEAAKYADLGHR